MAARTDRMTQSTQGTGFLLWRVSNRWRALIREALSPLGLTHVGFLLLASLTRLERDQPITQRRLAEHASIDVMMTSQVLRALERDGLIERRVDPTDARSKALHATGAGRELARRASAIVARCDERFFSPLGAEAAAMRDALSSLERAAG